MNGESGAPFVGGGPGTIEGGASGTWNDPPAGGKPVVGSGAGAVRVLDLEVSTEDVGRRRCNERNALEEDPLLKLDEGRMVDAVLLLEPEVLELMVGREIERLEVGRTGVLDEDG